MKAVLPYLIVFALIALTDYACVRYSMTAYESITLPVAFVCPDEAHNPNHIPAPHCWDDDNALYGGNP